MSNVASGPKVARRSRPDLSASALLQEIDELGQDLAKQAEPQAVLTAVASRLVSGCGIKTCGVWMVNETDSALDLIAKAGDTEFPASLNKASLAESTLGKAAQTGAPQVLSPDSSSQDPLAIWAKKQNLPFLATFPLVVDSKVQGVLMTACAESPEELPLALIRVHSRLASLALRNAQLLTSTQRTLTKLRFLVEASQALGSTLDLSELLGRILDVAKTQVEAERGSLFLVDEAKGEIWSLIAHGLEKQEIRLPLGKGISGHVAQTGEIVNIPDAYSDSRFNPDVDKRTGFRTRNILCLPIRNKAGKIIAALQLLNKVKGVFTKDDSDFLLTLSGHMALALENAQLHQALVEKERLEKEFALARGIQRSLLPETPPVVEGFQIAILNEPCYAVGGDYYDFLTLGQNTLLVVIADVEGKGLASAMIMSNLQATLRSLVLHLHSLDELAESLNRMILADTRGEKYMTMFMGLIDLRRKRFHYINCGHVPPVIIRRDHASIPLTEGGMVIGLFENAQYQRGHEKFQTGDVLVLCTDGITESMDVTQEEYGLERLAARVQQTLDKSPQEIVSAVSEDVATFSRGGTHIDDKVMLVIKAM